ncbi:RDD family protein [Sulfitobacter donghicola]|uniref:RDD family protein n=1 Tax=Sulfitobacter donghicola DSW-25 = KCTC 12864 = JCM 14565 TaxID=1300350 RepID=A0A073IEF2_9RHOB|nr:RDD family protein [Sulfitobacter donghicola]KEJ87935.1 RDD family protein [Sulfitobacter donghicola DSW-25 = KCTC 12864 = JCM 14565]KIN66494.1 RDD family protein [Sulfitobacter donghicola DSW-25 = KCTC 12864 = JCM 14565]
MTPDPDTQPQFYDSVPTKRLLAWGADTIIILVLTLVVIPFTAFIGLFFLPFLFIVLGFAYRVVTLSRSSATWGMQFMAIEMRTRDDQKFDLPTAVLHTLGYTVSITMPLLQLISIVLMLSTDRRQGLTDMVLGTVALNRRG